jgi:hypothetical protein
LERDAAAARASSAEGRATKNFTARAQANRDDLRNMTHGAAPPQPDEPTGPRLVIASHEFSRAQANYVALRHPENPRAPIFYKDATPRAENYVRCGVRVHLPGATMPRVPSAQLQRQ